MKKLFLLIISLFFLSSCTNNQITKKWGGEEVINLPKGQRFINATWKEDDIWYISEPMSENYVPKEIVFKEVSSFGIMEGKVTFVESK